MIITTEKPTIFKADQTRSVFGQTAKTWSDSTVTWSDSVNIWGGADNADGSFGPVPFVSISKANLGGVKISTPPVAYIETSKPINISVGVTKP